MEKSFPVVGELKFQYQPAVTVTPKVLTTPSPLLKIAGNSVHVEKVGINLKDIQLAIDGSKIKGMSNGDIVATSKVLTVEGKPVVLLKHDPTNVNDKSTAFKDGPNGSAIPSPVSFDIKIADANQPIFKCE